MISRNVYFTISADVVNVTSKKGEEFKSFKSCVKASTV